jgi:ABC-type branched-subunit amino acid transport system substrate-binding protein
MAVYARAWRSGINARGGINEHRVELVALDDQADPQQAIRGAAIGARSAGAGGGRPFPARSTAAAMKICDAGLPVIAIESAGMRAKCVCRGKCAPQSVAEDQTIFVSNVPDPNSLAAAQDFVKNYNAIPIDGTRAGPIALQAYDAMNLLFEAIDRAGKIDRGGVQAVLRQIDFTGLGAKYAFDQQGNLFDPQTYVFEYDKDRQPRLIR